VATDLPVGEIIDLTVAYTDSHGNPAQQPGPVSWSSSQTSIATVAGGTPDTGAVVTPVAEGTTTISAVSGGITATLDITVVAGVATTGTITAGTPQTPPSS